MDNNQPYHTKTPYPRTIGVQATAFCPRHAFPDRENLSYGIIVVFSPRSPVSLSIHSSFFIHHSSLSYTFSAKEKDSETGLSYFGSRYYSSDLSVWLSVDPQAAKYPSLSPYTYCADNPVKLVDPNGEEIRIHYGKGNKSIKYTPGMKVRKRYDAFVKDAITGLNFLYDHPEGNKNRVGFLAKSEIVLDVYQQTSVGQPSTYSGERRELLWDNKHIDVYEEGSQSPVVGLAHEIDHADRSIKAWEKLYECEDSKGSDCDQYVERAYSRDTEDAEKSAMEYENFIGRKLYNGRRVSSYQRKEYIPPIKQIEAKTIFSIAE